MKSRIGFVSNSSSSSFVLAFKGTKPQLKKKLKEILDQFPEEYPIKFDFAGLSDIVISNLNHEFKTVKAYCGERDIPDEDVDNPDALDEEAEKCIKILKEGGTVYMGGFDDQNTFEEQVLCNSDIYYEDDELYFEQSGGY